MALLELAFQPRQKASLGFEVFKLSELLARLEHVRSTQLDVPLRLDFHLMYVGLRGKGEVLIDFAPVPIGKGWFYAALDRDATRTRSVAHYARRRHLGAPARRARAGASRRRVAARVPCTF